MSEIGPALDWEATIVIDANGRLATESFVVAHLHLDKVMTGAWIDQKALELYNKPGMEAKAIALASRVKERYDVNEITARVRGVLQAAILHGVTHMRAFADVDTKAELKGVTALLRLKEEFRGLLELQIVAFPQEGIVSDPGAEDYVRKAMLLGADVVGGIPWIERSRKQAQQHIDAIFSIAKEFDKGIAMLVDDTGDPHCRTLEMLARKTLQEGYEGRVQACHARAMSTYSKAYLRRLLELIARAKIGLVTNPHTGPLHMPVRDVLAKGVLVALGQDDIYDAYYSYGRCHMIEVAFLASHLLRLMTPSDMELLYDMVTTYPARILGLTGHRLTKGADADIVVLDVVGVHDALRSQAEPRYVISHGRLAAENVVERRLHTK